MIFLYAHPAVKAEYFKHLTATICGAAPLGALDEQKFREKVGRPIELIQGNKFVLIITVKCKITIFLN